MTSNGERSNATKPFSWTIISIAAISLCWYIFAYHLVPMIIVAGYKGQTITLIDDIFSGRDSHSLDVYLRAWNRGAKQLSVLIAGIVVIAILPALSGARRGIEVLTGVNAKAGKIQSKVRISGRSWRGLVAGAVVVLQIIAALLQHELWPFSNYPMYSEGQGLQITKMVLKARTKAGDWIPLTAETYFPPLDQSRLTVGLESFLYGTEAERRVALPEAVKALAKLYEQRRLEGSHQGPVITTIRLERSYYTMRARANAGVKADSTLLLFEQEVH